MTRHIHWTLLLVLFLALAAPAAVGQTSAVLTTVQTASASLTAYSADIQMTQHQSRGDSVIDFSFDFVPTDRMRIVYTSPASVDGQTMILNGDQFYTYIPSLNRHVWQTVSGGDSGQGQEMGFLYDFVTHAATDVIQADSVQVSDTTGTYTLEKTGDVLDVVTMTLTAEKEKQVVTINLADGAPVAIDIYKEDKLTMEVRVQDYVLDGPFEDAWFAIPKK
jgi:outer membrane lipoprotein-sorting protein